MATVKVKYHGGIDEVTVLAPSGATYRAKRGDTIDMLASDAATLSPTEWDVAKASKTPNKPEEGDK